MAKSTPSEWVQDYLEAAPAGRDQETTRLDRLLRRLATVSREVLVALLVQLEGTPPAKKYQETGLLLRVRKSLDTRRKEILRERHGITLEPSGSR